VEEYGVETRNESYLNQRKHRRYIVSGIATIETELEKVIGRVVSVGLGGVLVYCDLNAPTGSDTSLCFSVSGLEEKSSVIAKGRLVWSQRGKVGLEFIEEPTGLSTLLLHLEKRKDTAEIR
jgi:hypothetical protein